MEHTFGPSEMGQCPALAHAADAVLPLSAAACAAEISTNLRVAICTGFAGVEDFDFWQSGALLALNTFGSFLACGLSLPLVCLLPSHAAAADGRSACGDTAAVEAGPVGGSGAAAGSEFGAVAALQRQQQCAADQADQSDRRHLRQGLQTASVAFLTARTLNAAVATASAAIQRRHLMVWALFAPKFLFDACILLVCNAAVILGIAMALVALRTR